ncbi:hypothetical protein [Streptomyces sp. NBC_00986]|uniref:hypothetical protein n=1 Tax=Streptomyces sp. NBC_00986 TaxID=2903702 RepID=UPI00386CEE5A|nr:hypothetical protein OG504_00690 [Streptomyces sp. NBC_00986]
MADAIRCNTAVTGAVAVLPCLVFTLEAPAVERRPFTRDVSALQRALASRS